jgi:hypothetical protein
VSATRPRHLRKNVGLVHQEHDRVIGVHPRERTRQIVDAAKPPPSDPMRELIADARQPEFLPRRAQQHRVVFKNRDTGVRECAAHAMQIVPPIVIAEDRPDAERRAKPAELTRPQRIVDRHEVELVKRLEIAEQHDSVAVQRVRGVDNVRDVRQRHVRAAGIQVGDHRDGELLPRRPVRRRQRVA